MTGGRQADGVLAPAGASTPVPPVPRITVEGVAEPALSVVPALRFTVRIESVGGRPIESIALHAQIRIVTAARAYDARDRQRLAELFGGAGACDAEAAGTAGMGGMGVSGTVPHSMLWTHASAQVPAFTGATTAVLPVACTYDFEVAVAKYFHTLSGGEIPLEFLFNGTIFYLDGDRLQAAMIPWATEAAYRMPLRAWQDMMDHHFPHSAWLRLGRDVFDRLYAYRVRHALPTWDDVVGALLSGGH
jgi:hypothetical protein